MNVIELLKREPVRVYLYTVLTAVMALLVGTGVMTETVEPLAMAVAAALLGVPGVEKARSQVTPVDKVDRAVQHVIENREV